MKIAIVGSRSLRIDNIGEYLPKNTTEIVSGGAVGVDECAREYAVAHNIKLTEFTPDYPRFGRAAPLRRNDSIIDYADMVIIFWDGISKGSKYVIEQCKLRNKEYRVVE